jgi:hypothetical protein
MNPVPAAVEIDRPLRFSVFPAATEIVATVPPVARVPDGVLKVKFSVALMPDTVIPPAPVPVPLTTLKFATLPDVNGLVKGPPSGPHLLAVSALPSPAKN